MLSLSDKYTLAFLSNFPFSIVFNGWPCTPRSRQHHKELYNWLAVSIALPVCISVQTMLSTRVLKLITIPCSWLGIPSVIVAIKYIQMESPLVFTSITCYNVILNHYLSKSKWKGLQYSSVLGHGMNLFRYIKGVLY